QQDRPLDGMPGIRRLLTRRVKRLRRRAAAFLRMPPPFRVPALLISYSIHRGLTYGDGGRGLRGEA
ncbi:MAG: hypothetical protein LBO67_06225, partial [Spirochaetaceae bacterium]|nr:hypothetical protein [Spirochaetaceae bacterium]